MNKLRPVARAYLISIGVWCGLSVLTGWNYQLFDKALNIHSSLLDMVRLAEARGFSFAVLTPPIFYLVRRHVSRFRGAARYAIYFAGLAPFLLLYALIHWVILPPWDPVAQHYVARAGHSPFELIESGFADQITMYLAILVAAHGYQYFERVRKEELARYELQQALAASELQLLKMQLHPHFLFNTLHGISTLIDSDQKTAKAMIIKLSSLLRTALEHGSSDLIPLSSELKFVENYLELEKMRLGPRLKVNWSIEPGTGPMLVPQLILQPLVENAIRHGVAASREGGWVNIAAHRRNGVFELSVQNNVGAKRPRGTGVGLRNTEARLKYLYGDEAYFSFREEADHTATATLNLPALASQATDALGIPPNSEGACEC
ncbi:MAG TPA: histidine kinase [Terriglobales bacterium]|nr:histidine kinase [Terriglobales bacterium]